MDILETKTKVLRVADLRPNEGQMEAIGVHANPRQISEVEYQKLLNSLRTDNLTGVLQEKVFNYEGEWIVLDGNMRLRALQELGVEKVQCTIVPEDTPAKVIEKIIILSNSTFGEWDMDALANWDEPLADWGLDPKDFEGTVQKDPTNSELDVDSFDEEQTLKLKFKPEQYTFVLARLREYGDDFSTSLLLILGYKPDDYE